MKLKRILALLLALALTLALVGCRKTGGDPTPTPSDSPAPTGTAEPSPSGTPDVTPEPTSSGSGERTAVRLAEAGLGVCIAPQSAATQGSQSLVSRPLTRPIRSEVVLVSPEDGQLSPAARRFAELLEEKET